MVPLRAPWKAAVMIKAWRSPGILDVLIYRELPEGKIATLSLSKEKGSKQWQMTETLVDPMVSSADIEPTFQLSEDILRSLVAALVEHGIKPPNEYKLAGLYEAQSKHVADLQQVITHLMTSKFKAPELVKGDASESF
jgi:hypothetical protein